MYIPRNLKASETLDYQGPSEATTLFTYDKAGNLETTTSPRGVVARYAYEGHLLKSIEHSFPGPGSEHLERYEFQYDYASRVKAFESPDGQWDYQYDAAGQLASAGLSGEAFTYDRAGNRTNTDYNTQDDNELQSDGVYNYEYDDEGNRTKKIHDDTDDYVSYEWDHRNRLTEVTFRFSNGNQERRIEYRYDVNDLRIAKYHYDSADDLVDRYRYIYDNNGELVMVLDGSDYVVHRYLYGPAVDQVLADEYLQPTSGTLSVRSPLADHLGTVRDLIEYDSSLETTELVNHTEFDSFGNLLAESNPDTDQLQGYTGREWDADAELYYYRARWYDPVVGRFVSTDPIGFDGGDVNLYRYVGNNAINATHPSGLKTKKPTDVPSLTGSLSTVSLYPSDAEIRALRAATLEAPRGRSTYELPLSQTMLPNNGSGPLLGELGVTQSIAVGALEGFARVGQRAWTIPRGLGITELIGMEPLLRGRDQSLDALHSEIFANNPEWGKVANGVANVSADILLAAGAASALQVGAGYIPATIRTTAQTTLSSPLVSVPTTGALVYIGEEYSRAAYYAYQAGDTESAITYGGDAALSLTFAAYSANASLKSFRAPTATASKNVAGLSAEQAAQSAFPHIR